MMTVGFYSWLDSKELSKFPVCLLQLGQLSSLHLSPIGGGKIVDIRAEIPCFSQFTALTKLDLTPGAAAADVSDEYSSEQLPQLDWMKGFLDHGVLQFCVRNVHNLLLTNKHLVVKENEAELDISLCFQTMQLLLAHWKHDSLPGHTLTCAAHRSLGESILYLHCFGEAAIPSKPAVGTDKLCANNWLIYHVSHLAWSLETMASLGCCSSTSIHSIV